MPDPAALAIGAEASCTDGPCGHLTQVVLDPTTDLVTHVIVEPEHREGLGRLVPVERVASDGHGVSLSVSRDEFEQLPRAEVTQFLPGTEGRLGYEPDEMFVWPYYGGNTTLPVTLDTLPAGEVAIRRDEDVHAADGRIGKVDGLIVDSRSHHATHLVLQEGHFLGKKDVAIPISMVEATDDGIRLSATKDEIENLPPVDFDRSPP